MKCESKTSIVCEKEIPKEEVKYINKKEVCNACFEKIKRENKSGN